MPRLFVLALALAACGQPPTVDCQIDVYVKDDLAGDRPIDCGHFKLGDSAYTDQAMASAQACVVGAQKDQQAFALVYDVPGAQHLQSAFTGAQAGAGLRLRAYAFVGDTEGGSRDRRPAVTVETCKLVATTAGCAPAVGKPCLDCQQPSQATSLCHF
jgi:hypothetical protein